MPRIEQLRKFVQDCSHVAASTPALAATGTLTRVTGLVMEAVGLRLAVGSSCSVILPSGKEIDAEVVGFADDRLFLMPASDVHGVVPGARVVPVEPAAESPRLDAPPHPRRRAADQARHVPVGFGLLGRVLDCTGVRSIRSSARRSPRCSTWASARSIRLPRSAAASAWACSPAAAWGKACCSA
jgi:flagellum-specific ATP synthase